MTGLADLFPPGGPFFLIAGPCLLERDALNLEVAEALARMSATLGLPIVYKASFDKANRSRAASARGPGLDAGLRSLERVRRETGLRVLTDIHAPEQAAPAADVCDALQIPAFLCRQTDLVESAARTGRALNIKKGQWMAPEEMAGPVEKARAVGARAIAVTERGTAFGYGDLIVDMRSFIRLREATGCPAIFDGTHSVQRPGRAGGSSGGDPHFIPGLVRAAVAAGADGLFLEVHPRPETAPSDGTNMLRLSELGPLLEQVLTLRSVLEGGGKPAVHRAAIAESVSWS
jgi:2-dehydro-3-deoxyphosphooctonate aldolase (KDO 8-P synthase)